MVLPLAHLPDGRDLQVHPFLSLRLILEAKAKAAIKQKIPQETLILQVG